MDNLQVALTGLGISAKLTKKALSKLVFNPVATVEVKLPVESAKSPAPTTVVGGIVQQTSIDACVKVLQDAKVDESVVAQAGGVIKMELMGELDCSSDMEFGMLMLILQMHGMPKHIVAGCQAVIKTETGADFPTYNPVPDFIAWTALNVKHKAYAMAALDYLMNCYDDTPGDT